MVIRNVHAEFRLQREEYTDHQGSSLAIHPIHGCATFDDRLHHDLLKSLPFLATRIFKGMKKAIRRSLQNKREDKVNVEKHFEKVCLF